MKNKLIFVVLGLIVLLSFVIPKIVDAQSIAAPRDTIGRIKVSLPTSHLITLTLTNNERFKIGDDLNIDFDNNFQIDPNATAVDFDLNDGVERNIVSTNGLCVGFNGTNDIAISLDIAASKISFIPCGSFVQSGLNPTITIRVGENASQGGTGTNRITNPAIPGTYTNIISIGGSRREVAVQIILEDQLSISGTVDPMIIFSISANDIKFGQFITTKARYATTDGIGSESLPQNGQPVSIYAGSNGQGGVSVYASDAGDGTNSGLWADSISELIPATPATSVVDNSKTFAVYGKNASGLSLNPLYDNDILNGEQAITRTPQILASTTTPLSGGSFDLVLKASTTSVTKAGHYVDVITILCTAIY